MVRRLFHLKPQTTVPVSEVELEANEPPISSPTTTAQRNYPTLLSYDEIPGWYQDNPFIRHGYRPVSNSTRACLASWLYIHNETINIFSHLIPALLFLALEGFIFRYFQPNFPKATVNEQLIFAFFLLTAAICLGLSAAYHTLMNHSEQVSNLWLRVDFVGIVVLIVGVFVSGIYVCFYCEVILRNVYWTMILTLGLLTMIIVASPTFEGRRWRTFRVCLFFADGLSGIAPLAHGIKLFRFSQMVKQSGMPYYFGEAFLFAFGALVYTKHIPERFNPGKFDMFGHSHQLFHVLVVCATAVHLAGILSAFNYNYHHRVCGVD